VIKRFNDGRDWFFEKRFGMFVHWGLYALPAWHEQILWRSDYKRSDYEKLAGEFNPVNFDPDAWLDAAEAAGMEYLCFTTKHHDGFCMWDTKQTDYRITNTPYSRDVLAMLAEACERRGILLCLYYSLPDWHHPNYPNQGRHHEMFGPRPGDEPDGAKYLEYVREQVRELVTGYGPIHAFFWDVNVAEFHDPTLNALRSSTTGVRARATTRRPSATSPPAASSPHRPRRASRWAARAGAIVKTRTITRTSSSCRASTGSSRWAGTTC